MTSLVRLQKSLAWLCFLVVFLGTAGVTAVEGAEASNRIKAVTAQQSGGQAELRIRGESVPTYTMYELFDPLRIVLDIADAEMAAAASLPANLPQGPVARIKATRLAEQKPVITRFEIFLADDREYSVERQGSEIVISFAVAAAAAPSAKNMAGAAASSAAVSPEGTVRGGSTASAALVADLMKTEQAEREATVTRMQTIEAIQPVIPDYSRKEAEKPSAAPPARKKAVKPAAPASKETPAAASAEPGTADAPAAAVPAGGPTDSLTFAGYENRRITVDFYKIDLHNVFRLFGEISGRNIVVDEEVKGSLTLALNDVPWDFALDIVLNLKDLEKEERFNTIVIAPKKKGFTWPKQASDSIAFKTAEGGELQPVDPISVKQRLETPKEIIEAKKLVMQAQAKDKAAEYRDAMALYEEAFALWPANDQLAGRIATLALVQLNMNAKAAHYAQAAVKANPDNREAALQAAIALANMKKIAEAKGYFDMAIGGTKPAPEALFSYASFCEEYKSYGAALALLKKYEELHSATFDTMIATARVYDKMGDVRSAVGQYQTLLLSGFEIPADLRRYIEGRIAAAR